MNPASKVLGLIESVVTAVTRLSDDESVRLGMPSQNL